jgi:hypothetical protein
MTFPDGKSTGYGQATPPGNTRGRVGSGLFIAATFGMMALVSLPVLRFVPGFTRAIVGDGTIGAPGIVENFIRIIVPANDIIGTGAAPPAVSQPSGGASAGSGAGGGATLGEGGIVERITSSLVSPEDASVRDVFDDLPLGGRIPPVDGSSDSPPPDTGTDGGTPIDPGTTIDPTPPSEGPGSEGPEGPSGPGDSVGGTPSDGPASVPNGNAKGHDKGKNAPNGEAKGHDKEKNAPNGKAKGHDKEKNAPNGKAKGHDKEKNAPNGKAKGHDKEKNAPNGKAKGHDKEKNAPNGEGYSREKRNPSSRPRR